MGVFDKFLDIMKLNDDDYDDDYEESYSGDEGYPYDDEGEDYDLMDDYVDNENPYGEDENVMDEEQSDIFNNSSFGKVKGKKSELAKLKKKKPGSNSASAGKNLLKSAKNVGGG